VLCVSVGQSDNRRHSRPRQKHAVDCGLPLVGLAEDAIFNIDIVTHYRYDQPDGIYEQ